MASATLFSFAEFSREDSAAAAFAAVIKAVANLVAWSFSSILLVYFTIDYKKLLLLFNNES